MLEIETLAVDHGKLRAIWDVSLNVGKGARVGLLGANGAGKSTTLGAILGIYPPAKGDIRFDGKSIMGVTPSRNVESGIALVPEGRRLSSCAGRPPESHPPGGYQPRHEHTSPRQDPFSRRIRLDGDRRPHAATLPTGGDQFSRIAASGGDRGIDASES